MLAILVPPPAGSSLSPQHTPWLLFSPARHSGKGAISWLEKPLQKAGGHGGTALWRAGRHNSGQEGHWKHGCKEHHWHWAEDEVVPSCNRTGSAACPSANFCPCHGQQCPWARGARFACFPPCRGCHLILRKASSVPDARQFCLKEKVKVTPKKIPANLCKQLGREARRPPEDLLQGICCPSGVKRHASQKGTGMPAQLSWWARSGSGCPRRRPASQDGGAFGSHSWQPCWACCLAC